MSPPNLLVICISAFLAVFVLLAFLALVMRGLMALYPERALGPVSAPAGGIDAATLAAVAAATAFAFPGTRVTHVEEEP
jgi:Na+-transporting methylmalonyl-CoA/oxaloacetate decarboxylase gamma subunit